MKVVITGSRGFLGRHLVHTLNKRKNLEVVTINHKRVSDRFKLKDATHIIHLAGVNRGTKEELRSGNVKYTKQLLTWLNEFAPMATIIFASSSQVYVKDWFYGEMKLQVEKILETYVMKHQARCICLRFSNIYGPFCRPFYNSAIATFIYQIMHGQEFVINGDGSRKRDFLYVTDAIDAIQKAMSYNPKKAFSVYDICSGSLVSLKRVIRVLREVSPNSVMGRYTSAPKDKPTPKRSNCRAKKDFNWMPVTSLSQGFRNIFIEEYGATHQRFKR